MLCIPRESTASPVDSHPSLMVNTIFAPSSSPSSSRRFFGGGRKEVAPVHGTSAPALATSNVPPPSVEAVSPISPSWSMLTMTDAPSAGVSTAVDDAPVTSESIPPAQSSTLARSSSRWLSLVRSGTGKGKRGSVHGPATDAVSEFGGKQVPPATESGSHSTMPRKKEGKTRLVLPWMGAKDTEKSSKQPTASSSRSTPAPIPLSQATRHSRSDDDDDEDESDDLEFSSDDELHLPSQQRELAGPSLEAPPPAAFYPPSRGPSSVALVEAQPTRRPKPSQSHTNILQLTSISLQFVKQSAHPLITPRSNGTGVTQALFPRSCNPSESLPRPRSVLVTLHKARVVQRLLEIPGSLTASEELSIMPFATRRLGIVRNNDRPSSAYNATNSIYPSHFQLSSRLNALPSSASASSHRVSLTRSLMIEDGDPMREPDAAGRGCSTWSRGLKQWVQRPTFEQRVVMWIPRSASGNRRVDELGAVRTAVYRPALKAQTPLMFSQGLEALAGVAPPQQRRVAFGSANGFEGVTQEPPLRHPKPVAASSVPRFTSAAEGLAKLHIPSPPQPSSSPSTSGSTDTGPSTPRSLGGSAQNLPVFAPGHGRSARHEPVAVSDDDDVPLGLVVRRRESDDTVSTLREKERKKGRDGAEDPQKAFKNQVLADRMRRESYRTTGRMEAEEEMVVLPSTARKGQPAAPVLASPRSQTGAAGSVRSGREVASESSRSIRSSVSIATFPSSRPPSVAISPDQTWLSNMNQYGQASPGYLPGAGMMLPPTAIPFHGNFPFGASGMPVHSQLYYPPPPVMVATTRSSSPGFSVGSMNSRRSSRYQPPDSGEFGTTAPPPKAPPLDHHSRSLPNRSATFNGVLKQQQQQHQPRQSWKSLTLLPPHDESRHRRSGSSQSQNSTSSSDQRPEHGRSHSSNRASALLRPSLLQSSSISSRRMSEIS